MPPKSKGNMMSLLSENKDFYPTPSNLFKEMWECIPREDRQSANFILEPSAGTGTLIEEMKKDNYRRVYHAIEKDPNLLNILRGKGITVIDNDFLLYSGVDKYDIIIANPPFSEGEKHLLKAIDIMYSGHIVFLLNAETLKNPYSHSRKLLIKKLNELNADVQYKKDAFKTADRKTNVEIALIHIHIKREIECDLFDGVTNTSEHSGETIHGFKELTQNSIKALVADYNERVEIGTETLINFYKNHHKLNGYMKIITDFTEDARFSNDPGGLTDRLKKSLNEFLTGIRKDYWRKVLLLDKVKERMTVNKKKEFNQLLQNNSLMDFTEINIRQFILNLINSYEDILTEAVLELFDTMTYKHAWDQNLHIKNTHYFDGWKTNQAYYVNKKVIIPMNAGCFDSTAFYSNWKQKWVLDYTVKEKLADIDKVMNYFDGKVEYTSIIDALNSAFEQGQSKKIKSSYFEMTVFKKGTIHLTFRNEDILRRFNVTACKAKAWLPENYGKAKYEFLNPNEQKIVESFEGKASYEKNIHSQSLFHHTSMKELEIL